jgi:membrane protein implicated in regulation of membrane protease activity
MDNKIIELNIVSWSLAIVGSLAYWLPLVQFLSFSLSVVISIWQLTQMVKRWLNKSKKI